MRRATHSIIPSSPPPEASAGGRLGSQTRYVAFGVPSSIFPPTQDVPPGAGRGAVGEEAWWEGVAVTLPLNRLYLFLVAVLLALV